MPPDPNRCRIARSPQLRKKKKHPLAPPSSDSGRGPEPQAQRGGRRRPRSRQRRFRWPSNPDMGSRAPPSCSALAHTTRTSAGDAPVGKRHFRGIALQKRNVHTCGPLVASICQTSPKTEREYCRAKTSPAEHYLKATCGDPAFGAKQHTISANN